MDGARFKSLPLFRDLRPQPEKKEEKRGQIYFWVIGMAQD